MSSIINRHSTWVVLLQIPSGFRRIKLVHARLWGVGSGKGGGMTWWRGRSSFGLMKINGTYPWGQVCFVHVTFHYLCYKRQLQYIHVAFSCTYASSCDFFFLLLLFINSLHTYINAIAVRWKHSPAKWHEMKNGIKYESVLSTLVQSAFTSSTFQFPV